MRKLVSLFLVLCMMCAAVPVLAEASQDACAEKLLRGEQEIVELAGGVFLVPSVLEGWAERTDTAYSSVNRGVNIALFSVRWSEDDWAVVEQIAAENDEMGFLANTHQVAMLNAMYNSELFDQETCLYIAGFSTLVDIGMPNAEMVYTNDAVLPEGTVVYAQTFGNTTNGVLVMGNDKITHEQVVELAQMIMKSVSTNPVEAIE